jgi:hypothetical protein
MEASRSGPNPFGSYYRQRWAIHLFEDASSLLETYAMFPREIRLAVRDGEHDDARAALIERYRSFPNIPAENLEDSTESALQVLIQANDVLVDMARLNESGEELDSQPGMTRGQNLLFHRSWKIALETPIEIIESAIGWAYEGQNS